MNTPERAARPTVSRRSLRAWWRRWLGLDRDCSHARDLTREDQSRSIQLLKTNLTRKQLTQYETTASFDVTGGTTGKHYRICHYPQMNVQVLDVNGHVM